MTIERSHDRPRLQVARVDGLTAPAGANPAPEAARVRPYRSSRHAVLSTLRRAQAGAQGAQAAALARRALCIYRGGLRELGAVADTHGPTVTAFLLTWAVQHACAQQLAVEAAAADLGSERGLALLAESQRAAGRSERAWTAAIAAAGLLAPKAGTRANPLHASILDGDDDATDDGGATGDGGDT